MHSAHLSANQPLPEQEATASQQPQADLQNQLQSQLAQQMIELQMSMAHLELTVERLDEVIIHQDKHIRNLQRQLQLVYKQVESQSADEGIAPFDVMADRPPHY